MTDGNDIESLRQILAHSRTIAVVGLSADWFRPSFFAAKYMQEHGYRIIPVNPKYPEILGARAYASLEAIDEPVDIVDVFRRPDDVPPIAEQAVKIGAKVPRIEMFEIATFSMVPPSTHVRQIPQLPSVEPCQFFSTPMGMTTQLAIAIFLKPP